MNIVALKSLSKLFSSPYLSSSVFHTPHTFVVQFWTMVTHIHTITFPRKPTTVRNTESSL